MTSAGDSDNTEAGLPAAKASLCKFQLFQHCNQQANSYQRLHSKSPHLLRKLKISIWANNSLTCPRNPKHNRGGTMLPKKKSWQSNVSFHLPPQSTSCGTKLTQNEAERKVTRLAKIGPVSKSFQRQRKKLQEYLKLRLRKSPPGQLQNLSSELHLNIFSYLDECSSICLGLTCKPFYLIHKSAYSKVDLRSAVRSPMQGAEGRYIFLIWLLLDWLGGFEKLNKFQRRCLNDTLPARSLYRKFRKLKTTGSRRVADYWDLNFKI
jgi:hypothetical protein